MARLALLAAPCLFLLSAATQVTPLQKVIDLLSGMSTKGKAEKHAEQVEFAKFQEWCKDTRTTTDRDIKHAAARIEELSADIAKAEADAEGLGEEIKELDAGIAAAQKELKDAIAVRKGENADFQSAHSDFSESVDALEKAIATLKAKREDVPQSLLQLRNAPGIPPEARATIESFLTTSSVGGALAPPEANAYEFQSGSVVEMLEKLRMKFKDQRTDLEKSELNSKSNHELLAQKLSDNIEEDTKRSKDKSVTKAQRLQDAATAKGDKQATEAGKAEDEKKLSETLAECSSRSEEFEKNQVVRAEELKAISQAVEILSSSDVAGAAEKHLPSLLQSRRRGRSFVQLRGPASPAEAQQRQALAQFLQAQAKKLGSRYLSLVAEHAAADPFVKVKAMIKDLIVKLMEEANEEADNKAYCDAELAKNKQTREDKQAEVEKLTATVEKLTAESAQLGEDLVSLADSIKEARKQQAEATDMRAKEKATNEETIAEAKAAQVAVERASKVLKDFYGKAGDDASFLQGTSGIRQASSAPYTGMQSEHGGIIGFLDVILSDFARLEADTSSSEDSAQSAYDKFMDESAQDVAVKSTTVDHKTDKKRQTDNRNSDIRKELSLTQEELDAALTYYEKLKPDCVDTGLSYEERVQMRREEIQSLKEALEILNQGDIA